MSCRFSTIHHNATIAVRKRSIMIGPAQSSIEFSLAVLYIYISAQVCGRTTCSHAQTHGGSGKVAVLASRRQLQCPSCAPWNFPVYGNARVVSPPWLVLCDDHLDGPWPAQQTLLATCTARAASLGPVPVDSDALLPCRLTLARSFYRTQVPLGLDCISLHALLRGKQPWLQELGLVACIHFLIWEA